MPIESKVGDLGGVVGGPKTMRQQFLKVSLINFPNQEGAILDCLITVAIRMEAQEEIGRQISREHIMYKFVEL